MQHKRLWSALLILVLLLSVAGPAFAQDDGPVDLAPSLEISTAIPGRYIVVFREGVPAGAVDAAIAEAEVAAAAESLDAAGGRQALELHYRYESALVGFAASMPASSLQALEKNPDVAYIEADQIITIDTTQGGATWGLDRIDQRDLPLSTTYTYNNNGAGVRAYIIDTGIHLSHNEFTGRVSSGFDAVDGGSADDCNGHGTHVAGTVGGTTYGVAKGVSLVAVRVLNCSGSGTTSGVIAGVDWVKINAQKPAVANMSLGGGASTSLDTAVNSAITSGVTFAVAAGNNNRDACRYSPARVAAALTVGATTSTDARASYSNYGSCLDLFAPGSSITSAWYTSNTATNTISGTSMATPHVAGVAALYLQSNSSATPSQVSSAIISAATTGKVINAGRNSPNRLLFTNY